MIRLTMTQSKQDRKQINMPILACSGCLTVQKLHYNWYVIVCVYCVYVCVSMYTNVPVLMYICVYIHVRVHRRIHTNVSSSTFTPLTPPFPPSQGARVGVPQLLPQDTTRESFSNTYTTMAIKIDQHVTADVPAGADSYARAWILSLMMFAYDVRVHAHPELSRRYNHLLFNEDESHLARVLSQDLQSDMQLVEGRMLAQYKDLCYVELDAALEEYFLKDGMLWDAGAMPHEVRPSCMELVQLLVGVEAELYLHAPVVLDAVLTDLVVRLFQVWGWVGVGGCGLGGGGGGAYDWHSVHEQSTCAMYNNVHVHADPSYSIFIVYHHSVQHPPHIHIPLYTHTHTLHIHAPLHPPCTP